MDVTNYINYAIQWMVSRDMNPLLCYPDEGAAKRYSDLLSMEYVFCMKHRDWRTGKIERLELTEPEKVRGRNILIVDDICSKGGTFTHTAEALRLAGAEDVMLYVTHCENTIKKGTVLTDGLISRVFTTNSILRIQHDKIEVSFICGKDRL
jgi:ribose-phosphate pyrophosphokinase